MFARRQALGDFKENVSLKVHDSKLATPTKSSKVSSTRKGLKSRSLNSYNATNIRETNKALTDPDDCHLKHGLQEKENSVSVSKESKEEKTVQASDDWSDIEEMHLYVEPEDDYGDIMPKSECIQKADIDALFMTLTFSNYANIIDDIMPSPPRTPEDIDFLSWSPDVPSSPKMELLYNDTPLDFVPLPMDF